jgi:hypothetical protein
MKLPLLLKIGNVGGTVLRIEDKEKKLVDLEVDEIREEWSQAFWKLMG